MPSTRGSARGASGRRERAIPEKALDAAVHSHEVHVYEEELRAQNDALRDAQSELEQTRDRFVELYDFAPNAYLTLDPNGIILQVNLTGAAWLGRSKQAIEGLPILTFVGARHRERVLDYLRVCRRSRGESALTVDFTLANTEGRRDVQLVCRPVLKGGHAPNKLFTAMVDITERVRLARAREEEAAARAALAGRLLSIQEEERLRIARDLHDNVGQQLTALRVKLALAKEAVGDAALVQARLDDAQAAANQLDQALDFIVAALRPSASEPGFVAAFEQFVRDWSTTFGIEVELHLGKIDEIGLSTTVQTHVHRIAQEALNNVYKHAKATRVSVIAERRGDELVLVIEDDGRGFRTGGTSSRHQGGFGLAGMRERAQIIGGVLEIESAPRKGATVFLQVPNAFRAKA
jgi:PAS domain S-box-containing protein